MISDDDYALLAGAAYTSTRSPVNQIREPHGWTPFWPPTLYNTLAGMGFVIDRDTILDPSSGFEARVFTDGSQTVIAYAGTYPPDVLGDQLTNGGLATGLYTEQLERAALVYAAVKQAGGTGISLTGHSLGGGLAALIGVYFNKPAITFDQAPFFRAAFLDHQGRLQAALTSHGFGLDADLGSYFVQVGLGGDRIRGADAVRSINVEGEFLSVSPSTLLNRIGAQRWIDLDDAAVAATSGFDLHAQSLLILANYSSAFRQRIADVKSLLPSLFDDRYFDRSTRDSVNTAILEHFVRHEFGVPGTTYASGDGMFRAFVEELAVLTQPGVMQRVVTNDLGRSEKPFQDAMNLVLQQGYYSIRDRFDPTRTLLKAAAGGGYFGVADATGGGSAADLVARGMLIRAISGAYAGGATLASSSTLRNFDRVYWQSGAGGLIAVGEGETADLMLGGAFGDTLGGGAGRDLLLGGDGADTLEGGAGNDTLIGGAGFDTYVVGSGKDAVSDDLAGEGVIRTGSGITLSGGKGAGKRDTWVGPNGEIYTFVQTRAAQLGLLTVTNLGPGNDVTIEQFDLAQAQAGGYLGIKLSPIAEVFIEEGGGTTPFGPFAFNPAGVAGLSTIAEGAGRSYTIYLSVAAHGGDTLTLRLSGLGDAFQAVLGSTTVPAHGAVITLTEGQTQVSFGLVQTGEVTADAGGSLSALYTSGNATASSNLWNVDLDDAGVTTTTLNGDQTYATYTAATDILRNGRIVVNRGETAYAIGADGNLVPGVGAVIVDNTLYGSSANDTINGLAGNDALNGGAGNDQLDGGEGDDLIAGGPGSNKLSGGTGNDFILGAGNLASGLQQFGPNDTWQAPVAKLVYGHGTTWGVYKDSDKLTIWDGAADSGAGSDANSIDAGDGDDHVIAGAGDDRVRGGAGDDWLDGTAGADVIEGGDGNDRIQADGVVAEGFLNTVAVANHGADFVDGGAGDDDIDGGGDADALFGGSGADHIFGDGGGRTDDPYFVRLEAHGADYIDGEDGDDYLEGGGSGDTIYGGAGNDTLWGDTSAVNIVGNAAGQSAADLGALAYGNDYLDGQDGNDSLVGGGGDDTLYGGTGNDHLWGDEGNAALRGEDNGVDYLDGGAGDDQLVGGGNDDTLAGGDGADKLFGDDSTDKVAGAFHGADHLDGGAGNDQLVGGGNDDILLGGDGDDQLQGDSASFTAPAGAFDGSDFLDGGDGNDLLFGGGNADTLIGGRGNDYLDGGAAADYLEGGTGDDIYVVDDAGDVVVEAADAGDDGIISSVSLFLPDNVERLTLTGVDATDATGNAQDNTIFGSDGANRLVGMGGNDTLIGRGGDDTLVGGSGDDVYEIDSAGDTVVEFDGQGDDFVRTTVSWTLPEHVERLAADGSTDLALTGNVLGNGLFGNAGNNVLTGGAGNDFLRGGAGDDTYVFQRGDGQDTVDNLDIAGADDTLRFGAGIADSDVVAFRSDSNLIVKLKGATDAVALLDYYGGTSVIGGVAADHRIDHVKFGNGVVWDQAAIQAAVDRGGSNRAPTVNNGQPGLSARAGDAFTHTFRLDAITDPDAGDSIVYSVGTDDGSAVPAWLHFDAATRTLTGTPDAADVGDRLLILWGTDDYGRAAGVYVTLNVAAPNRAPILVQALADQAAWQGGSFAWTVPANAFSDPDAGSTLSYGAMLADGSALPPWLIFDPATRAFSGTAGSPGIVSVRVIARDPGNLTASDIFDIVVQPGLTVDGTEARDQLDGSPGNDTLSGRGGDDSLFGYAGDDRLDGGLGSDTLSGGAGNDRLDGGAGTDKMAGGTGDDTYVVDSTKDVIIENANEGSDAVESGITHTLGNNVEHLILTGTAAINGTGNALPNRLRGNSANNTLNGGAGNDILEGGAGNDTLTDTSGTALVDGGAGADVLTGGAGSQILLGGQGDDTLATGADNDIVLFNKGDGQDTLAAGDSGQDTLSVGGGIRYADLSFSKVNNDLILKMGASDQITFKNWYAKKPTRSVANLQMIAAAMSDFAPGGSDPLRDNKVENFSFSGLVAAFDNARAANASLTSWALTNALASFQLAGSDGAAMGGDLAYQYGLNGTLAGIGVNPALDVIGNPAFGVSAQPLTPLAGLQVGPLRLS